jgi:RNA polymerase sigma-70 factor (ECF subfamily)
LDDAGLLERVGAGDKAALKALYERHSDALFRFIRARLRDPFEAGDVMQEVFLEIWRAAARFEGRSAAKTWIFGIARNKAVDRMRRGARTVLAEPDADLADDAPDPEAVAAAASDAAPSHASSKSSGSR